MRSSSTARGVRFCASSTTEQRTLALGGQLAQERLELADQQRLSTVLTGQAERDADRAQHVVRVELRADDLRATSFSRSSCSKRLRTIVGLARRPPRR
jgi:hypothetical protein